MEELHRENCAFRTRVPEARGHKDSDREDQSCGRRSIRDTPF